MPDPKAPQSVNALVPCICCRCRGLYTPRKREDKSWLILFVFAAIIAFPLFYFLVIPHSSTSLNVAVQAIENLGESAWFWTVWSIVTLAFLLRFRLSPEASLFGCPHCNGHEPVPLTSPAGRRMHAEASAAP